MQRFKNILYFADGADEDCPALKRAVDLAESNQARLTVVDVITAFEPNLDLEQRLGKSLEQLLHDSLNEALTTLTARYQATGQMIYTQMLHGSPFVEVIRAVQRNGFDLLIKAARASTGLSERLLGSTDLHLLRKCPCPVWIERPGAAHPYRHVLAAVNPMHDKPEENCDHLVMQLAGSLAQREDAQLSILHAWRLEGESILRGGRSGLSSREVDSLVAEEEQRHSTHLKALLNNYEFPNAAVHLVKGEVAPLILQYGSQADVIVMGTVGRAGIPGLIVGNTAEDVLRSTQASVLAVKPNGFESPVE